MDSSNKLQFHQVNTLKITAAVHKLWGSRDVSGIWKQTTKGMQCPCSLSCHKVHLISALAPNSNVLLKTKKQSKNSGMSVTQIMEPISRQSVVAELSTAVGKAKGRETSTSFFLFTDSGVGHQLSPLQWVPACGLLYFPVILNYQKPSALSSAPQSSSQFYPGVLFLDRHGGAHS